MIGRRHFIFSGIGLAAAGAFLPTAGLAAKSGIYTKSSSGIAINGYDPVAYFTDGKPVEGNAAHAFSWMGAVWHFASAENKALFEAMPDKYAPQYGGYCAYAVSYGSTASTVPEAWTIADGKLYLNYSLGVQDRWRGGQTGYIRKADKNWPGVLR